MATSDAFIKLHRAAYSLGLGLYGAACLSVITSLGSLNRSVNFDDTTQTVSSIGRIMLAAMIPAFLVLYGYMLRKIAAAAAPPPPIFRRPTAPRAPTNPQQPHP